MKVEWKVKQQMYGLGREQVTNELEEEMCPIDQGASRHAHQGICNISKMQQWWRPGA